MISNERPMPYGHRLPNGGNAKSGVAEETLKSEKIQIERKTFAFSLKQNPRGQFLRITEGTDGRRDTIIVPATGLEEFKRVLEIMIQVVASNPPESAA
jgi:hypothetical protein